MGLESQLFQFVQLMIKHGVCNGDDCSSVVPLLEMSSESQKGLDWKGP